MKAAVIYDGGFAEHSEAGRERQARITEICRDYDIALCGPNCMGILNLHHRSTTYLQELRDPAGLAGNIGIISHSGGLCVSLLADTRRFGFSHIVSPGNVPHTIRRSLPALPPVRRYESRSLAAHVRSCRPGSAR
jgi:acyl-CoA synthetase (NDP forming)